MPQAIIGSVQTTDPWAVWDQAPVERNPSVYPRQIDESTRRSMVVNYPSTPVGGGGGGYDDLMRQAYEQSMAYLNPPPQQPRGPTPYWEDPATYYPQPPQQPDPVERAKAATSIAYKYIAMRGYQQDLKEGKSAADAFAKWGPMLVQDTSFAPAMKAIRAPQPGRWVPANPATGQPGYYEGAGPNGPRPYYPPESSVPKEPIKVDENIQIVGGRAAYVHPRTGQLRFLDDPNEWDKIDYRTAAEAEQGAQKVLNNPASFTDDKLAATTTIKQARNRMQKIKGPETKSQTPTQAQAQPAAVSPMGAPRAGEVRKGYTFKGGNPALADNWEKVL